jgi:predicted DNA-binding transcriptional regulator AlpA
MFDKPIEESEKLAVPARKAAHLLSISERTLWSFTHPRGPIPVVRLGRSVRYSISALQDWLVSQGTAV